MARRILLYTFVLILSMQVLSFAQNSGDRMMLNAWYTLDESKNGVFNFDGTCAYPEGTRIEIAVYYDGFLATTKRVEVEATPTNAMHFTGKLATNKKVVPAYYVLRASFNIDNQPYKVAEKLGGFKPQNYCDYTLPVRPEDIDNARAAFIQFTDYHLKQIEDLNKELVDNFNRYFPTGSPEESKPPANDKRKKFDPSQWAEFLKEWNAKADKLKKDKADYEKSLFKPLFLTISEDIDMLYGLAKKISIVADDELYGKTGDFTDPMTGQKEERKSFAKWQEQFELALRARHIDLNYRKGTFNAATLVKELTAIRSLYKELLDLYNAEYTAEKGPDQDRWTKSLAAWETKRAALEKDIKKYESLDTFKQMEKGLSNFVFLPIDLKNLSAECTKALFGTPEEREKISIGESRQLFEITCDNARKALRIQADMQPLELAQIGIQKKPETLTPELKKEIQSLMKVFEAGKNEPTIELFKRMDQVRYQIANDYGPVAIDVLAERIFDRDKYMRENVATVLGMIQDKRIVPVLCSLIEQTLAKPEFEGAKMYAIEGLKRMGDKSACVSVTKALTDQSDNVKGAAADALSLLGDKDDKNVMSGLMELLDNIPEDAKPNDKKARFLPIIAKRSLETLLSQKLTIDVMKLRKDQLSEVKDRLKQKLEEQK